jgi:protease IV
MNERDLIFQITSSLMLISDRVASSYLPGILAYYKAMENGHIELLQKNRQAYELQVMAFSQGADMVSKNIDTAPKGSIAVIPLKGAFLKYGTACAYGADEITPVMYKAARSENIRAIVLDIDSGGGAENAVPPILEAIKFIQKSGKPVVGHGDMVGSAGYFVMSGCDYVTVDNKISSAFGSIGVLIPYMNIKKQLELAGIKEQYIYAPQSTLKNYESRELLENDNEEPLRENVLRPAAERFISFVKEARKGRINVENEDIWAGKLFEAEEIIKNGLADQFATLSETIEIAAALS